MVDERGIALIGADGVWSALRARIAKARRPRFARRTAWRALVPADDLPADVRAPLVHLWLGLDAHLVHYPVKARRLINIVAIVHEDWNETRLVGGRRTRRDAARTLPAGPGRTKRARCSPCPTAG